MMRVEQTFHAAADGSIVALVQGPTPGSDVWRIDLGHSALALYWERDGDRGRRELAALRQALDFIAGQLGLEATG
jgi:hypothetical protein